MKVSSTSYNESMKVSEKIHSVANNINDSKNVSEKVTNYQPVIVEMTDEHGKPTKQAYQTAVNKMNEFMEHTQRNSKFVFHDKLDKYYVEIVDAKTQEVVKEIPPKELLDAYYEMQKLAGKIFDSQA